MTTTLHYGLDSRLTLEFPPGAMVEHCAAPAVPAAHNSLVEIRRALAEPVGYPPLAEAVVPGDHVTIAIESAVPETDAIVAAIVQCVERAGASPGDVTLLRTRGEGETDLDPRRMLPPEIREAVKLETHDPADRGQLGYLANTHGGRPIYLHRAVCDADLVVLVGCMRSRDALGYHGVYGALYPTFSNEATQRRFRHPAIVERDASLLARAEVEVRRAGWLAGVHFVVQVVPGANDTALAIVAGEGEAVDRTARERFRAAWEHTVPERAELVIGALAGGVAQQTWDNFGRALAACARVVTEGGAIALCTELTTEPGPAVHALVDADDPQQALRRVRKHRPLDIQPATELAKALSTARVYLLSDLDESVVEELGMAAINDPGDLVRLARRQTRCIVLPDAQHNIATADEDAAVR